MRKTVTTILMLCLGITLYAQEDTSQINERFEQESSLIKETDFRFGYELNPTMEAVKITGSEVRLDGLLDEAIWSTAPVATGFTQRAPNDGGNPSQKTEARILYTNKEIYVGIMAYDTSPDSAIASLFRRDGSESSDWVYVSFDSYNDKRTAFTFAVNPRGVQKDILYFDDSGEDVLWDAVWEAEAKILHNGWSVEMKIPLSQLRFSSKEAVKSWGVNFQRRIARHDEFNYWSPTPQSESGSVSLFGSLNGIRDLDEPTRLEIIPYASTNLERAPGNPNNPFYNENELGANIGGDIRYGVTSDLTLSATINPDFGQVEADPATINLSQFEQFFSERRPFFLEGNDIFRFGGTRTYNNFGNPNTFYSRRIGGAPIGSFGRANSFQQGGTYYDPDNQNLEAQTYTDFPRQTSILGAAKLSGKTKGGTSVGTLYARTAEETSPYDLTVTNNSNGNASSQRGDFVVQPSSNFLVTRVKQDFNGGNSVLGGFFSGMNRDIDDSYFETYNHSSAFITGADFEHGWDNRTWIVSGTASLSNVNGTAEAITKTQLAPQRYYQRVDSEGLSVDPGKTNLTGYASELSLQKASGEHWTWSVTGSMVSPGYETNDIGFQNRADYRAVNTGLQYQENNPKFFQQYQLWSYTVHAWNYDNDLISRGYNAGGWFQFKNLWSFNINSNANFDVISDRVTRGGPTFLMPGSLNFNFNINSNRSKRISGGTGQYHRKDRKGEYDHYYWFDIGFRPTTFIQITIAPELGLENDVDQFVLSRQRSVTAQDTDNTFGSRYVFSDIRQANFSTQIRLNWTFNPKMSLQTYLRPFIATGDYYNLKEFNNPGGFGFDIYGEDKGTVTTNADGTKTIDPDGVGGEDSFEVRPLDFNLTSLQGNAVFRWEYAPGSTLFLVWQQQRSGFGPNGQFDFGDNISDLFTPEPTNVFLVKLSYWFGS